MSFSRSGPNPVECVRVICERVNERVHAEPLGARNEVGSCHT